LSLKKLELSYLEHIEADVQSGMGRFLGLLCALYVTFKHSSLHTFI